MYLPANKEWDQTQTKSVKKLTRGLKHRASSFKTKKLGVSSQASWSQPIPALLDFCWHCYFSSGKSLFFLPHLRVASVYVTPVCLTPCITACTPVAVCLALFCWNRCFSSTYIIGSYKLWPSGFLIPQFPSWYTPIYLITLGTAFLKNNKSAVYLVHTSPHHTAVSRCIFQSDGAG